jgi:U6 snRNA-associated Sm-like protein LSm3
MVLGEVEETVTSIEIDEETYEEVYKVTIRIECVIEILQSRV